MTDTRRVLVTGSRSWTDSRIVYDALNEVLKTADRPLVVVHGGAAGADAHASTWTRANAVINWPVVSEEEHPYPKGAGRRGGPARNKEMVDAGADECLAFIMPCDNKSCAGKPPHDSHGTADCMARAKRAGIPVREFRP